MFASSFNDSDTFLRSLANKFAHQNKFSLSNSPEMTSSHNQRPLVLPPATLLRRNPGSGNTAVRANATTTPPLARTFVAPIRSRSAVSAKQIAKDIEREVIEVSEAQWAVHWVRSNDE